MLVSIDTCRADRLNCYGYARKTTPNLDLLAQDGVLFKSAITPIPQTLPAHTSMLTGTYPPVHGVRLNDGYHVSDSNVTLSEILEAVGYQTAAFVGGYPLDSSFGLDQGFQTYDDRFPGAGEPGAENERLAEDVNRSAESWLEKHTEKPFFMFVHYYDLHNPYAPPAPFSTTYSDDPYSGELAYVDRCIGQLIDMLKARGTYDDTLFIVTGDHGEGLLEHGERQHGFLAFQSTLHVPLIIRVPKGGARGIQVSQPVSLVDIVPTVLDLIGLDTPSRVQGTDLRGYLEGTPARVIQRPLYAETLWPVSYGCSPLYALVDGEWKYILSSKPELYNLTRDGGEVTNLVDQQPQISEGLRTKLVAMQESMNASGPSQAGAGPDEEALQRLESLGYVGGGAVEASGGKVDANREAPIDFVPVFERLQAAVGMMAEARYREAQEELSKLVALRPDFYIAYFQLGVLAQHEHRSDEAARNFSKAVSILKKMGDDTAQSPLDSHNRDYWMVRCRTELGCELLNQGKLDEAIAEFQNALHVDPRFCRAYVGIGAALQQKGKVDEAVAQFEEALKINPKYATAHRALGMILEKRGKFDEAAAHFRAFLNAEPNSRTALSSLGVVLDKQGRHDEAIACFRKALALDPKDTEVRHNLGVVLLKQDKTPEAITLYREGICLYPQHIGFLNDVAWLLATSPEKAVRSGSEAIDLAKKAVDITGGKDAALLDTMAASYAEAQRYAEAVTAAEQAISLAKASGQTVLVANIQARLELYRAGRPYREKPSELSSPAR